jgi:hypothetical protein
MIIIFSFSKRVILRKRFLRKRAVPRGELLSEAWLESPGGHLKPARRKSTTDHQSSETNKPKTRT